MAKRSAVVWGTRKRKPAGAQQSRFAVGGYVDAMIDGGEIRILRLILIPAEVALSRKPSKPSPRVRRPKAKTTATK